MKQTLQLGAHVSASGGVWKCFENARKIGANTLQIFGSSPRVWRASVHKEADTQRFKQAWKESSVVSIYIHAPYLINLASPDTELQRKSVESLSTQLMIAENLGINGVIFHIGSGKEMPKEQALKIVVEQLKQVLRKASGNTQLIIENAAGGGAKIGATFDEIGLIMKQVDSSRVKVCIDTAHAFESGLIEHYTSEEVRQFFHMVEKHVGMENVVALHVNDSKTVFNSKHDRHENLGEGYIGLAAFQTLAKEKSLHNKAWLLEVPGFDGQGPDKKNLDILKKCFLM